MWTYDFEVFSQDWLVVIEHIITGQTFEYINDDNGLREFYYKHKDDLWIGFNNKRYDDYILKVVLLGRNPKRANDIIIEENNILKLFKLYDLNKYPLYSMDVSQDGMFASLKELEGYMGLDIEESEVDFTIDRKLTDEEIQSVLHYCRHDVKANKELILQRFKNLKLKMDLVKTFNLNKLDLRKTNAQLAAKILMANSAKEYDDELSPFILPDNIQVDDKEIVDFYCNSGELDYSEKLKTEIAGVPHTLAYGGLHGAKPNFHYEGELWMIDGRSFYPTIMIMYGYMSRGMPELMKRKFKEMYDLRLKLKAEGKSEEAEIYKLVINTIYGCMKDKYNGLYDPKMANNVCIAGQLLLIDIIEIIEPYCELVQSNTDGIVIIPHNKEKILEEIKKWEERTFITMEIDIAEAIYQKDVNNYIMVEESGKLSLKGGMVYQVDERVIRKSNKILDMCVVNYFVHGMTPEETIQNETDISNFQIITKTGKTFERTIWKYGNREIPVQKVNRVFATKDTKAGKLYKLKDTGEEQLSYNSIASLPDSCYVSNDNSFDESMLDRKWYVGMAWDRIKKFKGEKS